MYATAGVTVFRIIVSILAQKNDAQSLAEKRLARAADGPLLPFL